MKRHLIVGNSIEQVILIEDIDEANNVMEHKTQQDHIQSCFALNMKRPGWGLRVGGK